MPTTGSEAYGFPGSGPNLPRLDPQEIALEVEGLRLAGALFLPPGEGPHPSLTLCHGIPRGGPPAPGEPGYPDLARHLCAQGLAVLIFNFRGAGESQGNFDILGWARDLGAAVDYLWARKDLDRGRLYLLGSSAGGAVATYVAARDRRISGLVTLAAPAHHGRFRDPEAFLHQARRIGIIRDPGFPASVEEWLQGFQEVSPERWAGLISPRPLLILHGDRDEVVPVDNAHRIYRAAGEPKELAIIPGAGHRLRLDPRAVERALAWLQEKAGLG